MKMNSKLLLAFGVGFIATAGATLAQSYGRGRNVQFVDGAAISPSSVTTSGTVTAGSVVSNGDISLPAGSNLCLNASCTTRFNYNQGANNLDYFQNGAVRFAVTGTILQTPLFSSNVASGGYAYACSNVGCRLHLGSASRYLYDTGSTLASIGGLSADTFTATTASGSALTGGGASGPLLITSNTPDSYTTSVLGAIQLKPNNNLTAGDLVLSVTNSADTRIFTVRHDGLIRAPFVEVDNSVLVDFIRNRTNTPLVFNSTQADSASVVGVRAQVGVDLTTAGAKIMSFGDNANATYSEKAFIDLDGNVSGNGFVATTSSGSALTGGGASGPLLLTSNATDAATSGTVPAIRLQASQNITDSDLLMSVEDSAGNERFSVSESGNVKIAGQIASVSGGELHVASTFRALTTLIAGQFLDVVASLRLRNTAITIADSGGAGAAAYTQNTYPSAVRYTCNDADGCNITMSEIGIIDGLTMRFTNEGTNTVNFTDTAGVTELAGNFAMGQWDTIVLQYNVDRWVEISRSNN